MALSRSRSFSWKQEINNTNFKHANQRSKPERVSPRTALIFSTCSSSFFTCEDGIHHHEQHTGHLTENNTQDTSTHTHAHSKRPNTSRARTFTAASILRATCASTRVFGAEQRGEVSKPNAILTYNHAYKAHLFLFCGALDSLKFRLKSNKTVLHMMRKKNYTHAHTPTHAHHTGHRSTTDAHTCSHQHVKQYRQGGYAFLFLRQMVLRIPQFRFGCCQLRFDARVLPRGRGSSRRVHLHMRRTYSHTHIAAQRRNLQHAMASASFNSTGSA